MRLSLRLARNAGPVSCLAGAALLLPALPSRADIPYNWGPAIVTVEGSEGAHLRAALAKAGETAPDGGRRYEGTLELTCPHPREGVDPLCRVESPVSAAITGSEARRLLETLPGPRGRPPVDDDRPTVYAGPGSIVCPQPRAGEAPACVIRVDGEPNAVP